MDKPKILVKLSEMAITKNRLGDTPAHVRVTAFEPVKKNDEPTHTGLRNPKAKIRWFIPAGKRVNEMLAELFAFKPAPTFKYTQVKASSIDRVSDIHDPVDVYEVNIDQSAVKPTITCYDLGVYMMDGVEFDVVGLMTNGLSTMILSDEFNFSVVYMLDTANDLVEEEFLDHLHVSLTGQGFTTLYHKRACEQFEVVSEEGGVRILRSLAGPGQVVHLNVEPFDPTMRQQQLTIIAADKKDELFAFDEKGLDLALRSFYNWNFRVEISPFFKWI